jgi:hypothetical protein
VKIRVLQCIGFALYFIAYFLPSIGNPDRQNHLELHSIPGYTCAFFSIFWGIAGLADWGDDITGEGRRFFLSLLLPGLSNLLLLAYLGLALRRRAVHVRRVLAILTPLFMAASAVSFMLMPFVPLVGFYMWIAGATVTVFPDILQVVKEMRTAFRQSPTSTS